MRDDFSVKTKEELAKRVGYLCSNPQCRKTTIGAQDGQGGTINIGEAAHICAASPGGKRYDESMTPEERSDISNGIWLCRNCAAMIDRDEECFTKEILYLWKELAEREANQAIQMGKSPMGKERLSKNDCRIMEQIASTMEEPNTMYMLKEHDFQSDFQRIYLDPLFNLLDFLNKPTNIVQHYELKAVTDILIEKIGQFRWMIAVKGGPSKYGNGSYIIDRKSDQNKCNNLCNDIWAAYENVAKVRLNLEY